MSIRTTAFIFGLATLAGGCTVTPRQDEVRVYQHDRHVIHETDAYEGYYYVRIVYLNGVPWYVDEDLNARPVPPHLRDRFRYSSWVRSAPPRFSRDARIRDGYHLARIVYIDGAPYHVDEDRRVRPIPPKLRSRFSYESVAFDDDGGRRQAYGREREEPSSYGGGNAIRRATERMREEARPLPPAGGRERQEPPAYGADNARGRVMQQERMREEGRPFPPARGHEHEESSSYGGGNAIGRATERMREEEARALPPASVRERQERPVHGPDNARGPLMQHERMREEAGRQGPPFAREQDNEDRSSGREDRQDGRRGRFAREGQGMAPPADRQPDARHDREPAQSAADEGPRGNAVLNRHERSADAAPERKNGKGKGARADEETDSADERDGPPNRKRRRDE